MLATPPCPVHVVGKRVVNASGRTVYTDPDYQAVTHEIRCSGRAVWIMFHGGAASSQEAYVLVRSADGGRTFHRYAVPALTGYGATLRSDGVSGSTVTISAKGRTATVHT
ncbi:MAG TPA: hypothetical protein VMU74_10030 [Gaiellaceae bacterium]|nr:hypothetical protein [Gaiellaceae bacterium]